MLWKSISDGSGGWIICGRQRIKECRTRWNKDRQVKRQQQQQQQRKENSDVYFSFLCCVFCFRSVFFLVFVLERVSVYPKDWRCVVVLCSCSWLKVCLAKMENGKWKTEIRRKQNNQRALKERRTGQLGGYCLYAGALARGGLLEKKKERKWVVVWIDCMVRKTKSSYAIISSLLVC